MLTDDDFKEAIDVDIMEEKYLHKVIKNSSVLKKRSKVQFIQGGNSHVATPKNGRKTQPPQFAN